MPQNGALQITTNSATPLNTGMRWCVSPSFSSSFSVFSFCSSVVCRCGPPPRGACQEIKKAVRPFLSLDMPLWEGGHSDKQQKSKRRRQRKKKRRRGRHTSASRVWTDFVRLPIFSKSGLSGCLGLKEQCKCTKTRAQVQKFKLPNKTRKATTLKTPKTKNVKSKFPNIEKTRYVQFSKNINMDKPVQRFPRKRLPVVTLGVAQRLG